MSGTSSLPHRLLDMLVDGPSSFAGLYSTANRLHPPAGTSRYTVDELWNALTSMESEGWIRVWFMLPDGSWEKPNDLRRASARREYQRWLPTASFDEMPVDEVGAWYEIQPLGREEWEKGDAA
jgi:hypothetical protein